MLHWTGTKTLLITYLLVFKPDHHLCLSVWDEIDSTLEDHSHFLPEKVLGDDVSEESSHISTEEDPDDDTSQEGDRDSAEHHLQDNKKNFFLKTIEKDCPGKSLCTCTTMNMEGISDGEAVVFETMQGVPEYEKLRCTKNMKVVIMDAGNNLKMTTENGQTFNTWTPNLMKSSKNIKLSISAVQRTGSCAFIGYWSEDKNKLHLSEDTLASVKITCPIAHEFKLNLYMVPQPDVVVQCRGDIKANANVGIITDDGARSHIAPRKIENEVNEAFSSENGQVNSLHLALLAREGKCLASSNSKNVIHKLAQIGIPKLSKEDKPFVTFTFLTKPYILSVTCKNHVRVYVKARIGSKESEKLVSGTIDSVTYNEQAPISEVTLQFMKKGGTCQLHAGDKLISTVDLTTLLPLLSSKFLAPPLKNTISRKVSDLRSLSNTATFV